MSDFYGPNKSSERKLFKVSENRSSKEGEKKQTLDLLAKLLRDERKSL